MFGSSNAFGQSQTQSVFDDQTNNVSTNPFGTCTPFGAQTGSSMFGGTSTGLFGAPQPSSSFGASSQTFGSSSPAFGASFSPAFGSWASTFGGNSTFGQTSFSFSTPQSSTFGSTTQQSQSSFGSSTPFGVTSRPTFGNNAFGTTPAFGFGVSSIPSYSFGSSPAFGQSTSAFGSSSFGSTQSPFGVQAWNTTFGGSRVMPYSPTTEAAQVEGNQPAGKLVSLSAMQGYKNKSHEELRWEDYFQRGDKGGQLAQDTWFGVTKPQTHANPPNPISSSIPTNTFPQITPTKFSSPFTTPSIVCLPPSPSFATPTTQPFGSSSTPGFSSCPSSIFDSTPAHWSTPTSDTNPQTNNFITLSSTGPGFLFSSSPSLTTSDSPIAQTQIANQVPLVITNPFGTLPPALPQISNSVKCGISNIPVVDKPAPVRNSPLLTSRHLLQRRTRVKLPATKYRPGDDDAPKVPFFTDQEEKSTTLSLGSKN